MMMCAFVGNSCSVVDHPPTQLLQEGDDFFLPNDDPTSDDSHMITTRTSLDEIQDSSSNSLDITETIEEEETNFQANLALGYLEDFFYGCRTSAETLQKSHSMGSSPLLLPQSPLKSSPRPVREGSSRSGSSGNRTCGISLTKGSPRSIIAPMCSCNDLARMGGSEDDINNNGSQIWQRQNSLPGIQRTNSTSSSASLKPSLKRRNSSVSSLSSSKRNVSFNEISVREYDVELSNHPSCSYGPPIQLGWDYEETAKMPVEDYEIKRSPRREIRELVLSYNTRRKRLRESGYKKREIQAVEREVDRIKRERMITEFFLPAQAVDETVERVFGHIKSWFTRKQPQLVCQVHHI